MKGLHHSVLNMLEDLGPFNEHQSSIQSAAANCTGHFDENCKGPKNISTYACVNTTSAIVVEEAYKQYNALTPSSIHASRRSILAMFGCPQGCTRDQHLKQYMRLWKEWICI